MIECKIRVNCGSTSFAEGVHVWAKTSERELDEAGAHVMVLASEHVDGPWRRVSAWDLEPVRPAPGGRFRALVKNLKARGVEDPKALAAWIGRRKYGARRFAALAAAGRRRSRRTGDTR